MNEQRFNIPEFNSSTDFQAWWESPETVKYIYLHPDQSDILRGHPNIKPWLEQLDDEENDGDDSLPAPGKTFGKYHVIRKLGQGGMGVVYLAFDPVLNRKIALKIMLASDKDSMDRFIGEARAAAKLKHPNIVQVYEVGAAGKRHYFTMEYIEGKSLHSIVERGDERLDPKYSAGVIRSIAEALDYAHANGIIHRDIKPSNIIIGTDGTAFLTDFGLAKELTAADRSITKSGTILGTPNYMSPEQASGDKKNIDRRSDIFSLGATMYFAISRCAPFDGEELYQILDNVINKEPEPPTRITGDEIDRGIETICLKCLEKDPSRRYQTSRELAEDLTRYLNDEPISAQPAGTLSRLLRKARRNSTVTAAIAISAVLVVFAAAAITVSIVNKNSTERRIDTIKTDAEKTVKDKIAETAKTRGSAEGILAKARFARTVEERISIIKDALAKDPSFSAGYIELGVSYKGIGKYAMALECFTSAIQHSPESVDAYYERAILLNDFHNDKKAATADFDRVAKLAPDNFIGFHAKATLEFDNGNYGEAIAYYTKAVELNARFDRGFNDRGLAYEKTGEKEKAMADYTKAIELAPNEPYPYVNRANAYLTQKELTAASADINTAIRLNPNIPEAYSGRGNVFLQKEQYENAVADYNTALKLNPSSTVTYNNRGLAYSNAGRTDEAIADFTKALGIDPNYAKAYDNRGWAYYNKGAYKSALADYDKAIALGTDYAEIYNNRGLAHYMLGDYVKAIGDFTTAIQMKPNAFLAYNNRSSAYYDSGELDKCIDDLLKALELKPDYSFGHGNLGLAYMAKKENVKALESLTKAIELDPANIEAYYNRAKLYYDTGKFGSVIRDAENFIRLTPSDQRTPFLRQVIEECKGRTKN